MATTDTTSINDRGEIVGYAFNGDGLEGDPSRRAVRWDKAGVIREVRAKSALVPAAINEHQDVLSTIYVTYNGIAQNQAVLSSHSGSYTKLGDLRDNGPGHFSTAIGLSENGVVALNSYDPRVGADVACSWIAEKGVRSLSIGASTARGISKRGTMFGNVANPFYWFAWNRHWGAINIVEHLINSPAFDSLSINGTSGNGTLGGGGVQGSTQSAIILTPTHD